MFSKGRTTSKAFIDDNYNWLSLSINSSTSAIEKTLSDERQRIDEESKEIKDFDERNTYVHQFDNYFNLLDYALSNIRTGIFITIYSYWEKSLAQICDYYNMNVAKSNKKEDNSPCANDYYRALKELHLDNRPIFKRIKNIYRPIRNAFSHRGDLKSFEVATINAANFNGLTICDRFPIINDNSFLHQALTDINSELKYIENQCNINNNKCQ